LGCALVLFAGPLRVSAADGCADSTAESCFDDGRLSLDDNPAERSLRGLVIDRRNKLFAGADHGGERAAAMYVTKQERGAHKIEPSQPVRGCGELHPDLAE
jgi:hypothetical protein